MKYILTILVFLVSLNAPNPQQDPAFQSGEWFKFKMSYSGWFKAGEATLKVDEKKLNGKTVYHVVGKGKTTGAVNLFFKVRDRYESYFDKETGVPYKFIRKIDEGGHTKDIEIEFNHQEQKAIVNNKKHKKTKTISTEKDVQDMVSMYYYLRNSINIDDLKIGDEITTNMFFDEENYGFKLKYLGKETIKVDINDSDIKVKSLKFRPYVMAGRVFKEEESLTLWVSADKNKIPLKIKADLAVGSLRADLVQFKGLKHSFPIVFDN
ncbi:MAG: ATP-dependent exonuclease [Winogradskyella sp.]|nr:ATP-dependent exonuclease [Winogradskyella sp.]|tara:strand:+ start:1618 stop:2412 length:795 start_codon:yes stop_codon:yes gene_type:complete